MAGLGGRGNFPGHRGRYRRRHRRASGSAGSSVTSASSSAARSPRDEFLCETVVDAFRRECLVCVLVFGERHLRQILAQYGPALQRPPFAPGPAARTSAPPAQLRR